ncbi:vacuolar segregation protein PEP7-like [Anneissia japonica]|uniref:vacuolar segregation protein PEP7-like n=1 Tax=Anneissia japonica TaxID=1529436 RepID=UPI001425B7BD|nr:vacuolar segregation protein PEP7-like [Anneissia japonica]XP_033127059.1 vacuolar segregation protein PEP7-like [Anneissia japonica]XP_033127060.1 vacuolar segregation protein PEP7-like [Anneissia japonica]XP_033127061.1 vacuolar segregation protein PEP7-like [Anneissia japonica]
MDTWATSAATQSTPAQWDYVQNQVDTFVDQHKDGKQQEPQRSGISKHHWISVDVRLNCVNQKCRKNFTITQRKHHCRKCGEVFCKACVRYQRRLSARADYDPNGRLHQVCEDCFNSEPQDVGQRRLWTDCFKRCRQDNQQQELDAGQLQIGIRKSHQIKREMNRLIDGYTGSLQKEAVDGKKKLSNLKDKVQGLITKSEVPLWQKAKSWTIKEQKQSCMTCEESFNRHLANQKHNCRVCGLLTCNRCSSRDLLLFVADKHEREKFGDVPHWAVIKVTGCPAVEPDVHHYLRVCNFCKKILEHIQVEEAQKAEQQELLLESMTKLLFVHKHISEVQSKIDDQLPVYKQLVDGLEITSSSPRTLPTNRSNMQTLAKAQGDLMDHFTKFVMCVSGLKKFSPSSNVQVKLARNIMKCKFDYYHDNMYSFRKLKKQLEDVAPPKILSGIQEIVDAKTIEVACLSITQVAYETLHLCIKYSIDETLASNIIQTSELCKAELRDHMQKKGENWEQCSQHMEKFIKMQMKGDGVEKRQLYLRPSRRLAAAYGSAYITAFLTERIGYLALQIYLQLTSRSIDRRFKGSKKALLSLREVLAQDQKVTLKSS